MTKPVTLRTNTLDQWRINLNTVSNNVGDPQTIYGVDGSDIFSKPSINIVVAALNDLNSRKVKRSGDTIANLTIKTTLNVGTTLNVTGILTVSNTTNSSSPVTGALVVAGGLGLGGALVLAGPIQMNNNQNIATKDNAGVAQRLMGVWNDNTTNLLNAGGGTFRILDQAGVNTLFSLQNTGPAWLAGGLTIAAGGITATGNITSTAQFSGASIVVSGAAKIGTTLSTVNLSVTGTTTLASLSLKSLTVNGNSFLNGNVRIPTGSYLNLDGGVAGPTTKWIGQGDAYGPNNSVVINVPTAAGFEVAVNGVDMFTVGPTGRITSTSPDVWCGYCNRNWYSNGVWSALPMDVQTVNVGGFGWSAGAQGVSVPVTGYYKISVNGMGSWVGSWYGGIRSGIGYNGSLYQSGHSNYGVYHYHAGMAANDIHYLTAGTTVNFFMNGIANFYGVAGWCWMTIERVN